MKIQKTGIGAINAIANGVTNSVMTLQIIHDGVLFKVFSWDELNELLRIIQKDEAGQEITEEEGNVLDSAIFSSDYKELARILGQAGGDKGGNARAKALTPQRRSEIASDAAMKRWTPSLRTQRKARRL